MEILKFDEMKKTWLQIARYQKTATAPSIELEISKKMLGIMHVADYYYYIVDLVNVEIEMVSPSVLHVLGLKHEKEFTVEYIFDNIHPDDKQRFIDFERHVTRFFNALPVDKILKYKVSYDYRLRTGYGSYKWILMQTTTIQTDEIGSVLRVLGVQTDITAIKAGDKPMGLSFIGLEGEPSFMNVSKGGGEDCFPKGGFSSRELTVLKLLLNGKTSREISEELFISLHTVNSHRKNIFSKSGCKTLIELGARAKSAGWI